MIETRELITGSALIGCVAVKLSVEGKTPHSATLTAAADNTTPVYIAANQFVSWQGEHEGYALYPGQTIDHLAVETLGDLYAIAPDLAQRLSWCIR